ncbi:MAG TPA: BNR-4 repeat-containing protein [Chthoniobacteraceae bacterium]|jgi:hypothetical protein
MRTTPQTSLLIALLAILGLHPEAGAQAALPANYVRGQFHELNDNGAWSWFMDERVLVDGGRLIVGSARANGQFQDKTLPGWGNVELSVLDLKTGDKRVVILHEQLEQDDHNNPGLLVLRDGRYLAAYSKHGQETKLYSRISTNPGDPFSWQPETVVVTLGKSANFGGDSVTYCNPLRLADEDHRTYLFHRGHGLDPNYLLSEDDGRSWRYGGKLFVGRDGYSPYTKYIGNGRDTVHFVATEDHPRNFDNSLYHGVLRGSKISRSDGTVAAPLSTTTEATLRPWDLTRIFQGTPDRVAWMTDLHLDGEERPVVLFTVQVGGAGLPRKSGGDDHRFHYARWDGEKWVQREVAYAGKRLYSGEDDYTGLGAIDPQNTNVIYLSSDADVKTGEPLVSAADGKRHHEIFRGETSDGGVTWSWSAITANSTADNLRPLVPVWKDGRTALVWMRGTYRNNRGDWTTKVVATVLQNRE